MKLNTLLKEQIIKAANPANAIMSKDQKKKTDSVVKRLVFRACKNFQ